MTLTKKHFKAIAEILSKYDIDENMLADFLIYFRSENGLFDGYKFKSYILDMKNKHTEKKI